LRRATVEIRRCAMEEQRDIGSIIVLSNDEETPSAIRDLVRRRELMLQFCRTVEELARANSELLSIQKQVFKALG